MKKPRLSRRSFLRGTLAGMGVSLALPPLEAMLTGDRGLYADGGGAEPFFALFFWANGLPWNDKHGHSSGQDLWTPSTTGADYEAPELLQPLSRHAVNVATGYTPTVLPDPLAPGSNIGHAAVSIALSGDRPDTPSYAPGSFFMSLKEPSLDQRVAKDPRFYRDPPRFRSIVAAASEAYFLNFGHWTSISYNGPRSKNPPITEPTDLFDALFDLPASVQELGHRSRALDAVLEEANRLKLDLGVGDRHRLDAHLTHINEVQRRMTSLGRTCERPARPTDSGDLLQRTTMMAQLMALAVNCGLTRVLSFMLTSPASGHVFDNLSLSDGQHNLGHLGQWNSIKEITKHQMECFAAFLDAFADIDLPNERNLLDDGVVFGTSGIGEGNLHTVHEYPALLAGGGCGTLNRGVHTREVGATYSKVHLTALQALGLDYESFGFNGGETSSTVPGMLA